MIHLLHGVVDRWSSDLASNRNYVERLVLEKYLTESVSGKYGRWGEQSDFVLTVDDATCAGAQACKLARRFGHHVILFVNPLQIATNLPYFFAVLDAAIDGRTVDEVDFEGKNYRLDQPTERRSFRRAVKTNLMLQPAEEACVTAERLSSSLGSATGRIAPHQISLSVQDLIELRDIGVQIENHGWSHVDIAAMDDHAFGIHIERARKWLRDAIDVDSSLYAVPFGMTDVSPSCLRWITGAYFLADPTRPLGRIGSLGWNRLDITKQLQSGR